MNKLQTFFTPLLVLLSTAVMADDAARQLERKLLQRMPGIEITRITESPLQGLYEVVSGSQVVYMTKDARYMIDGDFVDLVSKRNHTEEARSEMRLAKINTLGEDNMLIYTPKKIQHTVTVITDINCPYCRRLHNEMDQYLTLGVRVRYIFMPLKGQEDYDKTVSVWCSEDRNLSLDIVKAGGSIESKTCDNPIRQHLAVSKKIGVRGTPAIVLEDGTMLPGYVPIEKLIVELRKVKGEIAAAESAKKPLN